MLADLFSWDEVKIMAEPELMEGVDSEAAYTLERDVRCPACREEISELRVVRLLRTRVNFTSTLPRRGRVMACPRCATLLSGELGKL